VTLTGNVPLGAGSIGFGYGRRAATASAMGDDAKQSQLGYRHDLSKRTSISLVWNKLDRAGGNTNDIK